MRQVSSIIFYLVIIGIFVTATYADVFMHYPPGSNNRNCENNNANVGNANRLFDSQNGNGGGYNCPRAEGGPEVVTPRMYYYIGTKLHIQWTMQHSCQQPNTHCQVVIQYACEDTAPGIRDGIPDPQSGNGQVQQGIATINEQNKDNIHYGQHEPFELYQKCAQRHRNRGLFIADRNLNGNTARFTRQNNNGNRHGFECAEERDYYPYWHPSIWKDIVIYTTNTTMCPWYQQESQNVKPKGECVQISDPSEPLPYNNLHECESNSGSWVTGGAHNIPPPECLSTESIATTDNHLGNTVGGDVAEYSWTIPDDPHKSCVIRIRYNISTGDVHPFETDSRNNGQNSPIRADPNSNDNFYGDFGYGFPIAIKINTNQYGRTFQDRSHTFEIRSRPDEYRHAVIHNLNIRGKRGNLQNIFPAMEYDFVPNYLEINGGDYVHFQWTGSDYNQNQNSNNAEGGPQTTNNQRKADRSNIVQVDPITSFPRRAEHVSMFLKPDGTPDMDVIRKLALLEQPINDPNEAIRCRNFTELLEIYQQTGRNRNDIQYDNRNCAKLGGAKYPYFDAGLVQMRASGTFTYISTRNNNFSNRSQRGIIVVNGGWFSSAPAIHASLFMILSSIISVVLFILA